MSKLNLENAKKILAKHTTEAHLFTHAAAVSAAMGAMAYKFGEDKEYWQAIGYLHDVDYEKFPEEHCKHVRELLAGEEVDDEDLFAETVPMELDDEDFIKHYDNLEQQREEDDENGVS